MKLPDAAIGGLFMAGLPGTALDPSTRELIASHGVTNFILFARNTKDGPEILARLAADLHRACDDAGQALVLAIDQEGGSVTRLPPPFTQFPDPREVADGPEPENRLRAGARVAARELKELGVTINLAPVLDVCPAGRGLYMERRALGGAPEKVARLGAIVIRAMQEEGVHACAKHFPGLGTAALDPHRELFQVDQDEEAIRRLDLPPFAAAINAGVAAVMISHTIHPALDPDNPATLSRRIQSDILRKEMGFDGAILSDDMEMGAIVKTLDTDRASVKALAAGTDLVLVCHDHHRVRRACAAVRDALAAGELSARELLEKRARVAALAASIS